MWDFFRVVCMYYTHVQTDIGRKRERAGLCENERENEGEKMRENERN